jgi:hypothetical protein
MQIRDIAHFEIYAVVSLLCEIINDLDVILHGFMLHIIYTTVFRVKRFNNLTLHIRLLNLSHLEDKKCSIGYLVLTGFI